MRHPPELLPIGVHHVVIRVFRDRACVEHHRVDVNHALAVDCLGLLALEDGGSRLLEHGLDVGVHSLEHGRLGLVPVEGRIDGADEKV